VIEESMSTLIVPPDAEAVVEAGGNIVVTMGITKDAAARRVEEAVQ
jgi:hypothetical protein